MSSPDPVDLMAHSLKLWRDSALNYEALYTDLYARHKRFERIERLADRLGQGVPEGAIAAEIAKARVSTTQESVHNPTELVESKAPLDTLPQLSAQGSQWSKIEHEAH